MSILHEILENKQEEVSHRRRLVSLDELIERVENTPPTRSLKTALHCACSPVALIAEVKKASPSRGIIRPEFNPIDIARTYWNHGAHAISVVTDAKYFEGDLSYLTTISQTSPLPILRKDFIIDDYQLWESRAAGADAVLLIVAALSPMQLREYSEIAAELSLDVLVEVHTESEMFIALDMGADLVGINNRDLMTFRTDLCVTERLASMAPEGAQIVSESGIGEREDVLRVGQAGARAVLVGESLMRSEDIATKMQELMGFGEDA